jgi:hypothetical protein
MLEERSRGIKEKRRHDHHLVRWICVAGPFASLSITSSRQWPSFNSSSREKPKCRQAGTSRLSFPHTVRLLMSLCLPADGSLFYHQISASPETPCAPSTGQASRPSHRTTPPV